MHARRSRSAPSLLFLALFVAALTTGCETRTADQPTDDPRPTTLAHRSTVYAPNVAVATSQPVATSAALRVLAEGGNAYDAAVVAATVLNVVEPHMTGIGGDVFTLSWNARDGELQGMRSIGRAGSLASRDTLIARGRERMPGSGAEAVTVPGSLAGWAALLERHGTLTLAEALAPAIRLAEEGFPVTPIIAEDWANQVEKLGRDKGARAVYLIDGERAPAAGEWHRNPDLAASFRTVARDGTGAFYGGPLGARIVEGLGEQGGFLTLEDLARHEIEWIDPISVPFRGYRMYQLPPPNQGIAALQMLRMLDGFELDAMEHNSAEYIHLQTEVKKLAYADLAEHIADPDHMRVSPEDLLSEEYLAGRRALIDLERPAERVEPGSFLTDSETIYLTVADAEGNMVSLINSIYGYFGSGVVVPGTGIMLQNRGAGFTLDEGHPNTIAPGKRPFHTIIPAFVTREVDGGEEPWLSFGVMGGGFQPQGHVQLLLNLLVFDMDLQEAIDAARIAHASGLRITLEAPIRDDVRTRLEAMGHEIGDAGRLSYGGAQAIMKLERGWAAGSDPRKDGHAAGG
ncbi:MAG: gamma-glutamyltransferase [Gemmatimonadota bacterium]